MYRSTVRPRSTLARKRGVPAAADGCRADSAKRGRRICWLQNSDGTTAFSQPSTVPPHRACFSIAPHAMKRRIHVAVEQVEAGKPAMESVRPPPVEKDWPSGRRLPRPPPPRWATTLTVCFHGTPLPLPTHTCSSCCVLMFRITSCSCILATHAIVAFKVDHIGSHHPDSQCVVHCRTFFLPPLPLPRPPPPPSPPYTPRHTS